MKLFKVMLLAFVLMTSAYANRQITKDEINQIEKLSLFERAQVKITRGFEANGIYLLNVEVRGKNDKVFLTKDKKYLIAGNVVDTFSGQALEVPDMPIDISILKDKEALTYGKGKEELILFTDPECPYCKKLESYLPKIEDKVTIKLYYFPLSFHKDAKDIAIYVTSQKTNSEKIKKMFETTKDTPAFVNRKISKDILAKAEQKVNEQIELGNQLGITGTPTIFDKNGNKVNWVKLLQKYGIQVK